MRLKDKADMILISALLVTIALVLLSAASIILLTNYLGSGEISYGIGLEGCYAMGFVYLGVFGSLMVLESATVVGSMPTSTSRRSAYVLALYPPLLLSYLLASVRYLFFPSIMFGLPLFAAGAVALPYCARVVRRAMLAQGGVDSALIICYRCGRQLSFTRDDAVARCPVCGTLNTNPLAAPRPPQARGPDPD